MKHFNRRTTSIENAKQQVKLVRSLRKLRRDLNISVSEVAEKMGVDEAMVYRFEKGGTNFTMSTLQKYAAAINASLTLSARKQTTTAPSDVFSERLSWSDAPEMTARARVTYSSTHHGYLQSI
ncbi:helix-turn-helix domain-containing protein [Corynebacterium ulceribovis]|uniref:helix-turn-helix domain-containing protein n=1 Tax=Corynebacterium ulceribovis TaxID=487732 RepID=UPI000381E231|nr:helix-turn-helix transcriptional regulator [Corynebacterium ulceribovis]